MNTVYRVSSFSRGINIYQCGREECPSLHSFGPAVRTHYLIHVILQGKGKFYENGKVHALQKGDAFLICPEISTYYEADRLEPWEYAWVGFDGPEAVEILKRCELLSGEPVYRGSSTSYDKMANIIMQLVERFRQSSNHTYELLGYLYLFFDILIRPEKEVPKSSYEKEYFNKAYEYISNNYSYDIRISNIAKYVGIDRTYLYKIFMNEKAIAPQQFLLQYRLNIAMDMLLKTSFNVTEIAYSSGFQDAPSFCRHFKNKVGTTPLQYRKQAGNISIQQQT